MTYKSIIARKRSDRGNPYDVCQWLRRRLLANIVWIAASAFGLLAMTPKMSMSSQIDCPQFIPEYPHIAVSNICPVGSEPGVILIFAVFYLIGSIPFGLLLTKLAGYGDIRKIGSGNIGATNVLRTGNKYLALATLLLDGGKGAFSVLIAGYFVSFESTIIAGFAAILGHMFPVWLKFKGGKGVATTLGMLLALAPTVGAAACLIWLLMAAIFRYSSLAALVAIFATPALAHIIYADPSLTGVCAIITVLVWFKHRANLRRLVKGEEPKIGKRNN